MKGAHIHHIEHHLPLLKKRSALIRQIREFFWAAQFEEVETPLLLRLPGQEPYLSPMSLTIHDDRGTPHQAFLHTSPEYTMKKLLAAGAGNIFSLGKTFRDYESFGGTHNPEFTMLEWYRVDATMFDLMNDVDALLNTLGMDKKPARISMKELWLREINVDLDKYLSQESMLELCKQRGFNAMDDESYEDLFYRIFLNEIEPTFNIPHSAFFIYNYPAPMAALATLSDEHPGYAERFELYIHGVEVANAFTELTDGTEQQKRLEEEQHLRKKLGKAVYDIDEEFITAVDVLPPCAGIALGVDRLVQVLLGVKNIDDILTLPASRLFEGK